MIDGKGKRKSSPSELSRHLFVFPFPVPIKPFSKAERHFTLTELSFSARKYIGVCVRVSSQANAPITLIPTTIHVSTEQDRSHESTSFFKKNLFVYAKTRCTSRNPPQKKNFSGHGDRRATKRRCGGGEEKVKNWKSTSYCTSYCRVHTCAMRSRGLFARHDSKNIFF